MSKTIDIEIIREAVANYMYSEGCSCCEGKSHKEDEERLGELLGVDKYDDESGYDFYKYRTANKG